MFDDADTVDKKSSVECPQREQVLSEEKSLDECPQLAQLLSNDVTAEVAEVVDKTLVCPILQIPIEKNVKYLTYFCICHQITRTYGPANKSKLSHGKI
ncbi:MAG: hypothetical protein LBJ16_03665 [Holosporaceae bacterium]|nr:hypothetical protein [Holosporaceae bacterium]